MNRFDLPPRTPSDPVDPRLDVLLRHLVAVGAVVVLMLPGARGEHALMGWLPLWLLGMPMVAWWALHCFAMPGCSGRPVRSASLRRPSAGGQAISRRSPSRTASTQALGSGRCGNASAQQLCASSRVVFSRELVMPSFVANGEAAAGRLNAG
ncbi:MAG: hypothetical protein M3Q42_12715 [Pseudomonadota bacterium]|nr:hypothetical protein [Pseudomonadota bacterium]